MPGPWDQYAAASPHSAAGPWSNYAPVVAPTAPAKRDGAMDAISGFLEGVGSSIPAAVGAIRHPLQALKDVWDAQKDQFTKANESRRAGKYDEALQHLAGGVLPVAGPLASDFLDSVFDPSVDAHDAAHKLGQVVALKALPEAVRGAAEAAPVVATAAKGAAKGAARAIIEPVTIKSVSIPGGAPIAGAFAGEQIGSPLGIPGVGAIVGGSLPIVRGAASGARAALKERAAALRVEAAKGYVPIWSDLPAAAAENVSEVQPVAATALPSGRVPGPAVQPEPAPAPHRVPVWAELPEPQLAEIAEAPPAGAPALPSGRVPPRGPWNDYAAPRRTAPPVDVPPVEPEPVPEAAELPHGISDAQRFEDLADQQAARMQAHAEDIVWANRAHRADRFAAYLLREGIEPTPVNLAKAAKEMGEKGGPPSDETVPMIHDRMNYQPQAAEEATRSRLLDTLAPPDPIPAAGSIAQVDPKTIKADPVRFQFKRDTGGAAGVGDKLKGLNTYNPDLGGMLNVWRDPADAQTYVVNGHHRLDLAQRASAPSVDIRYIDAANAAEARAKGALINIAEDQGTPLDAAKLFRDTGMTPADLKEQNIALNGKVARAGLGLSNLSQQLFDGVVSGEIPSETGSAIGELLAGKFADQAAVMDAVRKAATRGKPMTPAQIAESIRVGMRAGNEVTEVQDTLFGSIAETRSLFAETGELSDYIRKQLATEKRLFGAVSSAQSAERLGGAGNVINAGENSRIAGETTQAQLVYDKLSGMSGPVSDAIAAGARELATRANASEVKARTYAAVRNAISDTLPRTQESVSGGPPQGNSGGLSQAPGAAARPRTPKVSSKRGKINKIGDLGSLGGQ